MANEVNELEGGMNHYIFQIVWTSSFSKLSEILIFNIQLEIPTRGPDTRLVSKTTIKLRTILFYNQILPLSPLPVEQQTSFLLHTKA